MIRAMSARNEILLAIRAVAARDGTFTVRQVVAELARRGTGYSVSAISTHIISRMCVDAPDNLAITFDDLQRSIVVHLPAETLMTIYNKLAAESGILLDETENPGSCSSRRVLLTQPHVAGLEAWAREVAKNRDESVPSFDPLSGGCNARVLFLLQDPSRAASEGSRFISIDNNDQTAHNCSKAYRASGLDYG